MRPGTKWTSAAHLSRHIHRLYAALIPMKLLLELDERRVSLERNARAQIHAAITEAFGPQLDDAMARVRELTRDRIIGLAAFLHRHDDLQELPPMPAPGSAYVEVSQVEPGGDGITHAVPVGAGSGGNIETAYADDRTPLAIARAMWRELRFFEDEAMRWPPGVSLAKPEPRLYGRESVVESDADISHFLEAPRWRVATWAEIEAEVPIMLRDAEKAAHLLGADTFA